MSETPSGLGGFRQAASRPRVAAKNQVSGATADRRRPRRGVAGLARKALARSGRGSQWGEPMVAAAFWPARPATACRAWEPGLFLRISCRSRATRKIRSRIPSRCRHTGGKCGAGATPETRDSRRAVPARRRSPR